jgi:serine/threonine-protein phosphatase PPG1
MNKLAHMGRAHQLCMEGYQVLFRDTFSTIWSAPNYCHRLEMVFIHILFGSKLPSRFGNLAAVMSVDERLEVTSIVIMIHWNSNSLLCSALTRFSRKQNLLHQ